MERSSDPFNEHTIALRRVDIESTAYHALYVQDDPSLAAPPMKLSVTDSILKTLDASWDDVWIESSGEVADLCIDMHSNVVGTGNGRIRLDNVGNGTMRVVQREPTPFNFGPNLELDNANSVPYGNVFYDPNKTFFQDSSCW